MKAILRLVHRQSRDGHFTEVLYGALAAFVVRAIAIVLAFLVNVVAARVLPARDAGVYFLALTIVTIAATMGRFGLDNTILRLVAALASEEKWDAVACASRRAALLAFAIAAVLFLLVELFASVLSVRVFHAPELGSTLRVMAVSILPSVVSTLQGSALQGLKRVRDSILVLNALVPGFTSALMLLLAPQWGLIGAALSYTLSSIVVAFVGEYLWRRSLPRRIGSVNMSAPITSGTLLSVSVPLFWASSAGLAISWTSTLVLGAFRPAQDVAIFNVANRCSLLVSFVLVAVNAIAAPKFAALHHANDRAQLASVARKATLLMAGLALPILIAFCVAPEWVLRLFGKEYSTGASILIVLAIGQYVNTATGSVGYLLMMTGHEREMRDNMLFSAVVSLVLAFALIPTWGGIGAGFAAAVTCIIQNLGAAYLVRRRLGIATLPILNVVPAGGQSTRAVFVKP